MANPSEVKVLTFSHRLVANQLFRTWRDQSPEIEQAVASISRQLESSMSYLRGDGWTITSHSFLVYNSLVFGTFLLAREVRAESPASNANFLKQATAVESSAPEKAA